MAFGTIYGSGVDFTQIDEPLNTDTGGYNQFVETGSGFAPGTIMIGSDGSAFIYVTFGTGGATGNGYVLTYDADFEAVMVTTSNDAFGAPVGVAQAAATADQLGWLQIYGYSNVFGVQSALANNPVAASGTGLVDDAGAAGTLYIDGMIFTAAVSSGGNALTAAYLNWPKYSTVPAVA